MDADLFDQLITTLAAAGTRRRLLGLLSALPLVGGLVALLDPDEVDAHGRRHRRKKRHKHGKGRRRKHHRKKRCQPNSKATTCAGKCGPVKNNCKKTVDCGACACDPPCDVCFTCQEGPTTPGTCVVDPDQQGQACGDPGQVCLPDGSCACDASSCPACQVCDSSGQCVADPAQDAACCGQPNSGMRCQAGLCMAATATLAECQGRCDGGSVPLCGQLATCPSCNQCGCALGFCPDTSGPLGQGSYCADAYTDEFCASTACSGDNVICCGGACETICTTPRS
jgi:hypothetical protein